MSGEEEFAVKVTNAHKFYSSTAVLQGLDMSAKKGQIYGLLGPSGCGKTTLLGAIVGVVSLDAGTIDTSQLTASDIGYMPQDISLNYYLKVEEVLNYYGQLHGMGRKEIRKKSLEVGQLLKLPNQKMLLSCLSGGEQRRVSLAVTLFHDPQVLILDEPTVGLDPLLRESLWKHFLWLSHTMGKTVIITTHYIEEANQADTIGLLRGGILLCQDSPSEVTRKANCTRLEDVFLTLSSQQEAFPHKPITPCLKRSTIYSPLVKTRTNFRMFRLVAELCKNVKVMARNIPFVLFTLLLPATVLGMFNLLVSDEPHSFNVGYFDEGNPNVGEFCTAANMTQETCHFDLLTCKLRRYLTEKTLIIKDYTSLSEGVKGVEKNHIWAFLYLPSNYSATLMARLEEGIYANESVIEESTIKVYTDSSNKIIENVFSKDIVNGFMESVKNTLKTCGWAEKTASMPIRFNPPIYGEKEPRFLDFVAPAIAVILLFIMPLMYAAVVCVEEKVSGNAERAKVAGVSVLEIYLGHGVVQAVIQVMHTFTMMIFIYKIIGCPLGQPYITALILILQGLSAITFALLLATLSRSFMFMFSLSIGIIMAIYAIGGLVWPSEALHPILKRVIWLLPTHYNVQAIRGTSNRDWGFDHSVVLISVLSNVVWATLFTSATVVVVKNKKTL